MASVQLHQVQKSYDGRNRVIHGLDLEVRHGEFVVFVGPSGCGKSTLLRMIAGLAGISPGGLLTDGPTRTELPHPDPPTRPWRPDGGTSVPRLGLREDPPLTPPPAARPRIGDPP